MVENSPNLVTLVLSATIVVETIWAKGYGWNLPKDL
jgi:hypothetical protein